MSKSYACMDISEIMQLLKEDQDKITRIRRQEALLAHNRCDTSHLIYLIGYCTKRIIRITAAKLLLDQKELTEKDLVKVICLSPDDTVRVNTFEFLKEKYTLTPKKLSFLRRNIRSPSNFFAKLLRENLSPFEQEASLKAKELKYKRRLNLSFGVDKILVESGCIQSKAVSEAFSEYEKERLTMDHVEMKDRKTFFSTWCDIACAGELICFLGSKASSDIKMKVSRVLLWKNKNFSASELKLFCKVSKGQHHLSDVERKLIAHKEVSASDLKFLMYEGKNAEIRKLAASKFSLMKT